MTGSQHQPNMISYLKIELCLLSYISKFATFDRTEGYISHIMGCSIL